MAGIKDVAKKAGVSISTVSNVMNEKKPVSPELRQRVNEAIEALQYEVNPVGRGLKSNKTNQVGVIVPSFNQVYFPAILQGIHEAGFKFGYAISVFETGGDVERERQHVRFLQHSWIDGIILASYANGENISDRKYIRSLVNSSSRKKKIPVVSLENVLDPGIDAVVIDNKKAAGIAVNHLLEQGHKAIAHVAAPLRFQIGALRLEGYRETLEKAGLKFDGSLVCEGNYSPISGYQCMMELLEREKHFTAVFAANDQMGIGVIRALLDRGYRVPEDIAVIGIDNNFPSTLVTPSLSSVNLPKYELGYQAMYLLTERMKEPDKPRCVITLDTELIVRRSTSKEGSDTWNLLNW
ncbi:LacI family DNA-binding transcriptional regulator [Sinanaerobacter chloroacetimidivorans]|jgi:DNA-binding LacI/PurR family transcriptional regulator|uniref:LacI family DNA-binding transcriptional regulator n=1 Tax=Sinanaerobacter chloroacetimidivorans TaxID=2818044 RepID=A0A8J8B3M1_9FIRM|nr:LacI family DNA-binding transcriptional regulator [Sinanaerobacter chloroacetimidivorans]MBR0600459.1 LacI family DNA-binding transcriptional regulator [Sinanaerobacter chloroacetimidivorans]